MDLSAIANVSIVTSGAALALPGFGKPLILGAYSKAAWGERARVYSNLDGVAADFAAGTPEHAIASALFSQDKVPEKIVIGRGTRTPTQVFTLRVQTATQGADYEVFVDGRSAKFTAADAVIANILAGMKGAIDALGIAGVTTLVVAGTSLTITGAAGAWHTLKIVNVDLVDGTETTADPGVATDLGEIAIAYSDFYEVLSPFSGANIGPAIAGWTESNRRACALQFLDSGIVTDADGGATDVAHVLKGLARARCAMFYHPDSAEGLAAAAAGRFLPEDPGSETWALKTLRGVTAPKLSGTHVENLKAKNCGFYASVASRGAVFDGKTASGEWIDVVRGRDALQVEIQAGIVDALTDPAVKKIAFTDAGLSILGAVVKRALKKFEDRGFLVAGSSVVNVPKASSYTANERSTRSATGITFSANLAGAIHLVSINGTVTV